MSNTTMAVSRLRMPAFSGAGVLAGTCAATAHTAAVSAYKPSIVFARNGEQGGAGAWGPPV